MKKAKIIFSILISLVIVTNMGLLTAVAFNTADYEIISPYKDVIWEGDNAWGAYKGSLHSHTTYSDGGLSLNEMVKEYYARDFDFLANADHGVTGVEWNKEPKKLLLYSYQKLLGKKQEALSDEEFYAITNGTYNNRGKKMTCVTGANEFNNLTLTKCHVNGYFLPADKGNGFGGKENDFESAIKYIDENGGISHINHPGDWIESNSNPDAVNDINNISLFSNLILKYKSCYGIEVLNEKNGTTGYDRILWDNLLMNTLPYGKTVLGYSNTDAHGKNTIDTSYSIFMMEENNAENIKKTMTNGAFFAVTRILRGNDFEIGPKEGFNASNTDLPLPEFTSITVDGHKISVKTKNADTLQWIANGKVIMKTQAVNGVITLDLDTIENSKDLLYVRAEIFGEGGLTLTQPFIIDNHTEKQSFTPKDNSVFDFLAFIKNSRFFVIFTEIIRLFKR